MNIDPVKAAELVSICVAVGVVLNVIQAMVQQPWFPAKVKALITVGLSVVSAAIAYVLQNGFSWHNWPELILWCAGILQAAILGYHGVTSHFPELAKLELATSKTVPEALDEEQAIELEKTVERAAANQDDLVEDDVLATDGTENVGPWTGVPEGYDDGGEDAQVRAAEPTQPPIVP
jgi:hypothetical protein